MTQPYVWLFSHTPLNKFIFTCDMNNSHVWTWLIYNSGMMNLFVWHDWFICDITHFVRMTWFIWRRVGNSKHYREVIKNEESAPFMYMTWLIHMCDIGHSLAPPNQLPVGTCDLTHWLVCVTWLIRMCNISGVHRCDLIGHAWPVHICDMTHSYVRHNSFMCATWCIHMFVITHSYA